MTSVRKRRMTSRAMAVAYAITRTGTPVQAAGAGGCPEEDVAAICSGIDGKEAPYRDATGDGWSLREHLHWDASAGGGSRRPS